MMKKKIQNCIARSILRRLVKPLSLSGSLEDTEKSWLCGRARKIFESGFFNENLNENGGMCSVGEANQVYIGAAMAECGEELLQANDPAPRHRRRETSPAPTGGGCDRVRSFRWNLTASAARPNPQGSFHYGTIATSRTLVLASSAPVLAGQRRYAVNGVSFVVPDTPLKLVDNYNIANRPGAAPRSGTPVVRLSLHEFIEVVFQNTENELQSWHLDGYDFWVVG
uniref:Plastocyanin-like domain-containing protein n=1 Tax=Oryza meridionalis TaxID=40149 RepID=A0A0E0E700_9ORYZ